MAIPMRWGIALVALMLCVAFVGGPPPAIAGAAETLEFGASPSVASILPAFSDDDAYEIRVWASRVVRDVREVDKRVRYGGLVGSRLRILAANYGRLVDAPVPPGANASKYKARAQTLMRFSYRAADEYAYGSPLRGEALYVTIRRETAPLLAAINKGIGTHYHLP